MPFNLSTGEVMVLRLVAVLVFGGKLPEVARKVARGIADIKRNVGNEMRKIDTEVEVEEEPPPPEDWTPPPDGEECQGLEG